MTVPNSAPDQTILLPADWLPGYEIESIVRTGGFGTVFRARQLKLDRLVAVKVIDRERLTDPTLAARFEAEAMALGRFHHPNIVQVFDYGYTNDRFFIAMELLEGEDLGQRLRRVGKLDERVAWAIARQTASALAHAASLGVVHRDIKPANLFLIPAPTGIGLPIDVPMVKIMDFGLALTRPVGDKSDRQSSTDKLLLGTPIYMAPEQYRRSKEVDHRADIYALGSTIYHALSGRPPFDGASVWEVLAKKFGAPPTFWPEATAESIDILTQMMEPESANRVATYEQLVELIEQHSAFHADDPNKKSNRTKRWFSISRRKLAWPLAAVVLAAVATVMTVGLRAHQSARKSPSEPIVTYVSRGNHEALFDRESLSGWRSSGGNWKIESDEENLSVLSGTGLIQRSFKPSDNYRISVGLDLHKASAVEIHFGVPTKSSDFSQRLVIRVSKTDGIRFGAKVGIKGEFRSIGSAVPFPPPSWFADRPPYVEVRFSFVGGAWVAFFGGVEIGRAEDDGSLKSADFRVLTDGGSVRIDSVILERLVANSN